MMLDQNEDSRLLEVIKKKIGYNLPLYKQYFYFINDLSFISCHSKDSGIFPHYDKSIYSGWIIFNIIAMSYYLNSHTYALHIRKEGNPFLKY